jgi:hypothetical protein
LGCATSPAKIAAPPEPAVDIDALIARDGLLAMDKVEASLQEFELPRELVSAKYYELDGAAPPELIVHIRKPQLAVSTVEELWFYDVSDASAPRLLSTRSGLAARGERAELRAERARRAALGRSAISSGLVAR